MYQRYVHTVSPKPNPIGMSCKVELYRRGPFPDRCLSLLQAVCTEAGMFALRERRIHVTQEDFEMSVAKVMKKDSDMNMSIRKLWK